MPQTAELAEALERARHLRDRVEKELISMADAAELLGVSRQRVHMLTKAGKLHTLLVSGRTMLSRVEVEARRDGKLG